MELQSLIMTVCAFSMPLPGDYWHILRKDWLAQHADGTNVTNEQTIERTSLDNLYSSSRQSEEQPRAPAGQSRPRWPAQYMPDSAPVESGDVTLMYLTDAASTDSSWSFAKPTTSVIERGCELSHRNALSGVHVAREQHIEYPFSLVPCNRYFPEACKLGGGCCVRAFAEKQILAGDS